MWEGVLPLTSAPSTETPTHHRQLIVSDNLEVLDPVALDECVQQRHLVRRREHLHAIPEEGHPPSHANLHPIVSIPTQEHVITGSPIRRGDPYKIARRLERPTV